MNFDFQKNIIDAHVHISLFENNAKNLENALDLFVDDMQKNGIESVIIVPDNIEKSDKIADLNKARELVGDRNNFYFLGSPQIIQRGSNELEKYHKLIKEKTIVGLKFFPGHDPYYPTDERCIPYFDMCQKLYVPVLFHTGENTGDSECAKWNDPKYIVKIAKQFPQLKVIITHYFWPQMEYCYEITKDVDNIYFETAAMADKEVIEKTGGIEKVKAILLKTINDRPDNVVFGTDWPMCKIVDHINLIKSLNLLDDIEKKIFKTNAVEIYNL